MADLKLLRGKAVRIGSLGLGFVLCGSVVLPWFDLPLMGWSIPTPAWNALGLLLLLLGNLHVLRALGFPGVAWVIRLLLPLALFRWWGAQELFRVWGKQTFVPMQMRLREVNDVLSTLGADPVTVFAPEQWQALEPGLGWKMAGVGLILAAAVSLADLPQRRRCPACRSKVRPDDPCCHGCGQRFPDVPGCHQCGRRPDIGDQFCRSCGEPQEGAAPLSTEPDRKESC